MQGRSAMLAWSTQILSSTQITTAICWTKEDGWRGALVLSPSGSSLVLSDRSLKKLAESFDRKGGRQAGLGDTIDDMFALAREVRDKNRSGELPPNMN